MLKRVDTIIFIYCKCGSSIHQYANFDLSDGSVGGDVGSDGNKILMVKQQA